MTLQTLTDLMLDELLDIYDAEHQVMNALPELGNAAFCQQLRDLFEEHGRETETHIERLEEIFAFLHMDPERKHCRGMEALITEARDFLDEEDADPAVLDAALISAAQKIEHYEIAGYGCVWTYARTLQAGKLEKLLHSTLTEEEYMDRKLNALAENMINLEAAEVDREILREARQA